MIRPSRLTLGTAQLGMPYGVANSSGQPRPKQARQIIEAALDLGIRSFDTAPAYGTAERLLGEVIRGEEQVFVTSKLPSMRRTGVTWSNLETSVQKAIAHSKSTLGRIDAYLIHDADDLTYFGERLAAALAKEARSSGIGRIGISVYSPEQAQAALTYSELSAIQIPVNLLDQRALPHLAQLSARGILVFARSAFLQGLFAIAPEDLPPQLMHTRRWMEALSEITRRHGSDPMGAALPFLADIPDIDSVLIGVESIDQLRSNVLRFERHDKNVSELHEELRNRFSSVPIDVVDPTCWPDAPPTSRRRQ